MGMITVSNIGKAYKQYPNRWSRVVEWLDPRNKQRHQLHWVLQDISFTIQAGEAVGIVGVNGAGKSTLLKMITGTTHPTTGSVQITGRVAALLELGMGFHPEFTGRQNVVMAGQLLGYTIDEIMELMPQIEAFAAIGDYIDQPVRIFSSGMQVRLAFAVSTASRPDVLIVDEALSVGDAAFQRKCFQKIETYRAEGTTLLFVSHDIETVKKLCDRALFIKEGRLAQWGAARQVCDEYERYLFGNRPNLSASSQTTHPVPATESAQLDPALVASCEMIYGSGKADIEACWLEDTSGRRINVIESGTRFKWRYRVRFHEDVIKPIFAMMLKSREGIALYGTDSKHLNAQHDNFHAGDVVEVDFTLESPLAQGLYYLNCGVRLDNPEGVEFLSRRVDSAIMRVSSSPSSTVAVGMIELEARLAFSTHSSEALAK